MVTACWKFLLGFIFFGAMISHIGQVKGGWDWFVFFVVSLVGLTWLLEGVALFLTEVLGLAGVVLRTFGKLPKEGSPQQEKEQIRQELDQNLRAQDQGTADGRLDEGVTLTLDVKGISKEAIRPYVDDFVQKMEKRGRQLLVEIKEKAS